MKKRHHTYQIEGEISQFNLNSSISQRSHRNRYNSLRPSTHSAPTTLENNKLIESSTIWINEEPDAVAISDELSESELKTFSFRCIETLASLANFDAGQTIPQVMEGLVREKLPAFATLVDEFQIARNEHEEYKTWSKQFISKVQPLIEQQSGPASELTQLTKQAVHCVERSMFSKYTMQTLHSRIDSLIESIPCSVKDTGTELQLPSPIIAKLANHVKLALTSLAK